MSKVSARFARVSPPTGEVIRLTKISAYPLLAPPAHSCAQMRASLALWLGDEVSKVSARLAMRHLPSGWVIR